MFFMCSLCVSVKRLPSQAVSSYMAPSGLAHFMLGNGTRDQGFLVDGARHVLLWAQ